MAIGTEQNEMETSYVSIILLLYIILGFFCASLRLVCPIKHSDSLRVYARMDKIGKTDTNTSQVM